MAATTYDLTGDRRIEQGTRYGPFTFTLRNRIYDTWEVTIASFGTPGDVFSVTVFGADSGPPPILPAVTGSYTVQAGDDDDAVAVGLALAVNALAGVSAVASGPVVTVTGDALSKYLDLAASGTVPANISAANTLTVLIDMGGASVEAEIRKTHTTAVLLADLTPFITITNAALGEFTLDVPAATTALYTWEAGRWQCNVALATEDPRAFFIGDVENRLSMLLP